MLAGWNGDDCSSCHGRGAVISPRISRLVRCSCAAGRQLAQSNVEISIVAVSDLEQRKRKERRS